MWGSSGFGDGGASDRVRVTLFGPGARRGAWVDVDVVKGGVEVSPVLGKRPRKTQGEEGPPREEEEEQSLRAAGDAQDLVAAAAGADELVVACTPLSAEPTPQPQGASPGQLDALEHTPKNLNARFYALDDDDSPEGGAGGSDGVQEPHMVLTPRGLGGERQSFPRGGFAFEYSPIPSQASDGDVEVEEAALRRASRGSREGAGAASSYARGLAPAAPSSARFQPPQQAKPPRRVADDVAAEAATISANVPPGVFTSVRTGRSVAVTPSALAKAHELLERVEPGVSTAAKGTPAVCPPPALAHAAPAPGVFANARTGATMAGPSSAALERARRMLAEEGVELLDPVPAGAPARASSPPHPHRAASAGMFSNARTGQGVAVNPEALARGRDLLAAAQLDSPTSLPPQAPARAAQPVPRQPLSDVHNRATPIVPVRAAKPPLRTPSPRQQLGMTPSRAGRASVTPGRRATPTFRPPAMVSPGLASSRGSIPPASPVGAPASAIKKVPIKARPAGVPLREFFGGGRPYPLGCVGTTMPAPATSEEAATFRFGGSYGLGHAEVRELLVRAPGIDPAKATPAWVANHWRWIVWKLASYVRAFPDARSRVSGWFSPAGVLGRLESRYRSQFDEGRRSALHRILETDAHPSSHMILCVARILPEREGGPKLDADAEVLREVELTDGWWAVTGICDPWLSKLVRRGKIKAGQKLRVSGCTAVGLDEGLAPLSEGIDKVRFNLRVNGTRRARWDAKLGFAAARDMFTVPLSSVLPLLIPKGTAGPGQVPGIFIVVQRVYPALHLERRGTGEEGEVIFLGEEAEAAAQERLVRDRQLAAEAIAAADPHLDAESVSARVLELHPDRNVSRSIRARVTGLTGRKAEAIVTLWDSAGTNASDEGAEGMDDHLVEGAHLLAGPLEQGNTPSAGPFAGLLHLSPRRGCQWHVLPEFPSSSPHPHYAPRRLLTVAELSGRDAIKALPGSEFDITGLVLRVGTPKWGKPGVVRRFEQWVFLCDASSATAGGENNFRGGGPSGIVAVKVTASSTEREPFEDGTMGRRVHTFRNLAYVDYDGRYGVHQASFSDTGRLASTNKDVAHRSNAGAVEAWAGSPSGAQRIAWMQQHLARMVDE